MLSCGMNRVDSYVEFFKNFEIDINDAFSWRIENTIFPNCEDFVLIGFKESE